MHHYFDHGTAWEVRGTYYDKHGQDYNMVGARTAVQGEQRWQVGETVVRIDSEQNQERFHQTVFLEPVTGDEVSFVFNHAEYGPLEGVLQIQDDALQFRFASADGVYSGMEMLFRVNEYTYDATAVLFKNGKRLCAWESTLLDINRPPKEPESVAEAQKKQQQ